MRDLSIAPSLAVKKWTFNSLFEMQDVHEFPATNQMEVYLSILYLRCTSMYGNYWQANNTYVLSILYLRCRIHSSLGSHMREIVTFNSLFEMPPNASRRPCAHMSAPLSILYLRCIQYAAEERGEWLLVLPAFNSLFEMHEASGKTADKVAEPFNSLFEML